MSEQKENMSRRDFLAGTGGFAAGAAVGAALGGGVFNLFSAQAAENAAPPSPWKYVKLDPEVVRKKGYDLYHNGGCMYGAAAAIITSLQEKVGYPYTMLPLDAYRYGAGGAGGWGTLCGAPNGAAAAMSLVLPNADIGKVVSELMGWYSEASLPTTKHDSYAKFTNQVQSVAGNPLCHASVSNWCAASKKKENSDERKNRCAKVTGDTAAQAVVLLNAYFDKTFTPVFKISAESESCYNCHVTRMSNTLTKMDCTPCHPNAHKK